MYKKIFVCLLAVFSAQNAQAFWSLDTDVQFGFQIYDLSNMVNSEIQAVINSASRINIPQTDERVRACARGLNTLALNLRSYPIGFFNELSIVAISRVSIESTYLMRLKASFDNYSNVMKSFLNSTGPLNDISQLINIVNDVNEMRWHIRDIVEYSDILIKSITQVTRDVSNVRSNTSLILSPSTVNGLLNSSNAEATASALRMIVWSFGSMRYNIQNIGRIELAHGAYSDILSKVHNSEQIESTTSRTNFINSYNRMITGLIASVNGHKETATNGFGAFIRRIQQNYDETVVRAKFESSQRSLILNFVDGLVSNVYNTVFIRNSFDNFKDSVVGSFSEATGAFFDESSLFRELTLNATQKVVTLYPTCLDDLVTFSQVRVSTINDQYQLCMNERTSGIAIILPSTSTWLNTIRDNVNFILQQLNSCVTTSTTLAGRNAISNCIQSSVNNLPFYLSFLQSAVEMNLNQITTSSSFMFQNCMGGIINDVADSSETFNEIYERCDTKYIQTTTTDSSWESSSVQPNSTTDIQTPTTEISTSPSVQSNFTTDSTTTLSDSTIILTEETEFQTEAQLS